MEDGHVIIIVGAEDKTRAKLILSRFVALAGARMARIGVITAWRCRSPEPDPRLPGGSAKRSCSPSRRARLDVLPEPSCRLALPQP
jgi:cyanophycinase-like exopeptidase